MTAPATLCSGSLTDLDAVMDIMEGSFDPCFGEGWTGPQCASLLPMPGVWMTLALRNHDMVGFALARIILDDAELLLLAVKKEVQGHGVGRCLLHSFIEASKRRGARRLHLEVRDGNQAVYLYKRAGFSEIGRRKGYYSGRDGQAYDALTLERKV
jgi:[ribosomal protein S18]-alanine N-acetyltransferase